MPATSLGGVDRSGTAAAAAAGGVAGTYDGASVPVFGQLAGLDGNALDDQSAAEAAAASATAQTLPAAALAAVVALAAVTAALVRTHQASRARRLAAAPAVVPSAAVLSLGASGVVRGRRPSPGTPPRSVSGALWTAPTGARAARW